MGEIYRPPLYKSETVDFFDTLATPKQMQMCRDAAKAKGLDPDDTATRLCGWPIESLTKRLASAMIDRLKHV
jgi:hypothetical protein